MESIGLVLLMRDRLLPSRERKDAESTLSFFGKIKWLVENVLFALKEALLLYTIN